MTLLYKRLTDRTTLTAHFIEWMLLSLTALGEITVALERLCWLTRKRGNPMLPSPCAVSSCTAWTTHSEP